MADFQQLINKALANPQPTAEPSVLNTDANGILANPARDAMNAKKDAVAKASAEKKSAFSAIPDFYQIAAGLGNTDGLKTAGEVEQDLRTMNTGQIRMKYGAQADQLIRGLGQGIQDFGFDASGQTRTGDQATWDSVSGVAAGFAGGLGNIAALGAGLINDDAGTAIAGAVESGNKFVRGTQSDAVNAARRVQQTRSSLTSRDNAAERVDDIKSGDSELVADLKRFGRDFMDTLGNSTDPTMMAQGTSEAVGSLLSGGPVATGLRKIGAAVMGGAAKQRAIALAAQIDRTTGVASTARVADAARRVGGAAAWPLATGALEGGSAYTGTANDIMDMSFDELSQGSEQFRSLVQQYQDQGMPLVDAQTQARIAIASDAGTEAAAIQAPIGAVTGLLTRALERPFNVPSLGSAVRQTAINEPVEEAIQSATGQVAQNIAVRGNADASRTLSEGAGEASAQGALYGFTSAGSVQAPGAAAGAAIKGGRAIYQGARTAVATAVEAGRPLFQALVERGDRVLRQQESASPVREEVVSAAVNDLNANAELNVQTLSEAINQSSADDAVKTSGNQYVSSLVQAMRVDPQELNQLPDPIRQSLAGAESRADAVTRMAQAVNQASNDQDVMNNAAALWFLMEPVRSLQEADPVAFDTLPKDSPALESLRQYNWAVANIENSPAVKRALRTIDSLMAKDQSEALIQPVTEESLNTPAGQQNVQNALVVSALHPDKGNLEANEQILTHAQNGRLNLTPIQLSTLKVSVNLLRARAKMEEQIAASGIRRAKDVVSSQIVSGNDPLRKIAKSALQHTQEILSAVRGQNTELAAARLEDFGKFVQHMQNKVTALNTHFDNGNPNADGVQYQQLQPNGNREFKLSKDGMFVNTNKGASIDQAQSIGVEAGILADVYNGLVETFPDLAQSVIPAVPLNPALVGDSEALSQSFRAARQPARPQPVATPAAEALIETQENSDDNGTTDGIEDAVVPARDVRVADGSEGLTQDPVQAEPRDEVRDGGIQVPVEAREDSTPTPVAEVRDAVPDAVEPSESAPDLTTPVDDLYGGDRNFLRTSFTYPEAPTTRLYGEDSPIASVRRALSSQLRLSSFLTGSSVRNVLTPEAAGAYQRLLTDSLESVVRAVVDNLDNFLNSKYSKAVPQTMQEIFLNDVEVPRRDGTTYKGSEMNRLARAKVLNLTQQNEDGNLSYQPQMLEQASLAAMQWLLSMDSYTSTMDEADVAEMTGLSELELQRNPQLIEELTEGMSLTQAKRSLSGKIRKYWGLQAKSTADLAYAEGIPEAMAAEMLLGMDAAGLITLNTVKLTPDAHGIDAPKSFIRVLTNELADAEQLATFQDAIEVASMIEPEHTNYIGDQIPAVAQRQMNNNEVPNTKNQKDALEKEQQTPFYVNPTMVSFYASLGKDNLLALFGEPTSDTDVYNDNHLKTVEGRNKSVTAAFDHLFAVLADVSNVASATGKSIDQTPIRYAYNMSRVGRMQMLGKYSPQASKLVREAILPTRSTLDLSNQNSESFTAYGLSLAQALGIKVHNQPADVSVTEAMAKLNGGLAPAVEMVREWLSTVDLSRPTESASELTADQVIQLKDAFAAAEADLSMVGLHAVVDYARYLASDDQSAFQTSMYLEADGVTNGPINAMALMSIGNFTPEWVTNIAKGGLLFGPSSTMADIRRTDSKDLYQASTDATRARLSTLRDSLSQEGTEQMDHLLNLMSLFNKDVIFDPSKEWSEESGKGSLELKRGIAKNPLTITIYGSGDRGIAGKLTSALVGEIYARMSTLLQQRKADEGISVAEAMFPNDVNAADKLARFSAAVGALTTQEPSQKDGSMVFNTVNQPSRKFNPKTFNFTASELGVMEKNMLELFVKPMRAGIADTVGEPLMKAVGVLRDAAQVQSIFLQGMYIQRVDEALVNKEKTDPNWRRGDFLSRADLNKISAGLKNIAPLVQTGDQSFMISGQESLELEGRNLQYSRALNDRLPTDPSIYAPAQAGVRAIPMMTIGMGDGMMMQLLAQQGLTGTLKIFDGMNMPLDKIDAYSKQANAAVYESWKGNPHREMLKTYDTFFKNVKASMITDKMKPALVQTLFSSSERRAFKKTNTSPSNDLIMERISSLQGNLEWSAKSIDARHAAVESLPVSLDQMAAAGQPFTNGRVAAERLTIEQATSALNKAYQDAMEGGAIPVTAPIVAVPPVPKATAPAIETVGRVAVSGVRVLSATAMENLAKSGDMTEAQKVIFDEIRRSKAAEGYKVVAGNPIQLDGYIADNGLAARPSQNVHGWINVGDKTIYLVNPSTETLIHELVHASSFETVLTHYQGGDLGPNAIEIRGAIERLEAMMGEFLLMDTASNIDTQVEQFQEKINQKFTKEVEEFLELDANPNMTDAQRNRWEELDSSISMRNRVSDIATGELVSSDVVNHVKQLMSAEEFAELLAIRKLSRSTKASNTIDPDSRASYDSAVSAILSSNLESDQAVAQAKALNEFMAWGLTNEQLTKTLKTKQAPSLVQMAKDVLTAIKKLIWGKKTAPKISDDFLSNLQFNAGIVIRSQPSIAAVSRDGELFHSTAYGSSDRLTVIRQSFGRKINDLLASQKWQRDVPLRKVEVSQAVMDAVDVGLSFSAHGFPMTMQEGATFRMIVAALATEAEIDPNALARAQELYAHVSKTLKVEDFMADPDSLEPQDRYDAQQKYSSVMGDYITRTDAKGRTSLLPAFLALATVNDEFRAVLAKMPVPKTMKNSERNLDAVLENMGSTVMDSLSRRLAGDAKSNNVRDSMDNLMEHIRKISQEEQTFLDQYAATAGGFIDRANEIVTNGLEAASDALLEKAKAVEKTASNGLVRNTARVAQLMAAIVSEKNGAVVAEGLMAGLNSTNIWEPLRTLIGDLVGRTKSNANIYDMIKAVRSSVQQARQQFRDGVPQIMNDKFTRKVTPREWTAMFNTLGKTDLAVLRESMTHAEIANVLSDQTARDTEIDALEAQIKAKHTHHWSTMSRKMKQLANFMNTGVPGVNLLRNVEAISRLLGEAKANNYALPDAATKKLMDKLVTLYALETMNEADRNTVSSLVQSQATGVNFVVDYLVGQRKEEMRKTNGTALLNAYKGYLPSEQEYGISMQVADDTEFVSLREQGYTRVGPYNGSSIEMYRVAKSYYMAPTAGRAVFNQGIMQNVRHTAGGVDATSGFTVGMTAGRITGKQTIARLMARMSQEKATAEALMPVYDSAGEVIALERSVDPLVMSKLNKSTDLAKMIGVWRGRQVEEATSQVYNEQLIDNLKAMFDEDMKVSSSNKAQYINLLSPKVAKDNAVLADAVSLFTNETLAYIKDKFGDEFWVRRDMVRDAIGERSASVGDLWNGISNLPKDGQDQLRRALVGAFGIDAYKYMVRGEQILQNFMADMRTLIVVKSVIVPAANFVSNVYQLSSRGVPLLNIAKGMPAKIGEIDSYAKTRLRQIEAEAELRAATGNTVATRKLETEIQSITDAHKRLSIWPLIEAGEFSSIADVGMQAEDLELTSGKLASYIERQVDKLPDSVKTAGRYALITKDTALYRGLQKSVQYGDFIAKAVLYDDLTKRLGMSKADALARITEEFVNYDRLPGRFRSYLENMGLLWFYNFKIRSTKVALSTIRNNPVHALLSMSLPAPDFLGTIGSPIGDNIAAKALSDTLGSSVGTDMAFRAPTLNPWMNLIH